MLKRIIIILAGAICLGAGICIARKRRRAKHLG